MSLDWEAISDKALNERRITALTDVGAVIVWAMSFLYKNREEWTFGEEPVTNAQWDEIEAALGQLEFELMSGMIGMIIPHVLADLGNINALPCDGSSYLREDYPLLYEALDPVYIVDADNFRVPDMRDRFPLGAGVDYGLDDSGGAASHTLTEAEMPSHTHTNFPHSHSEVTASPTVGEISPGVPFPAAIPSVGVTGAASVTIDPTGGGEAHNNMPPFLAVRWLIVSG